MRWKKLIFILPLITIFSCQSNQDITTKCPLGAPSIVYYDQGNNKNFETISGAAQILAEFQHNTYDALIVDATNGLKQIKTYPKSEYRLAKLITAGNLYLVSLKHSSVPTINSKIISFGNATSIPHLVTEYLNKTWGSKDVNYETDVSQVLAKALNDVSDYYVLAEPAVTTLKSKKELVTLPFKQRLVINDTIIPQAALFINKSSYSKKKDKFNEYITNLNIRINNTINNVDLIKSTLYQYGDDLKVSAKFGFKSDVVKSVQSHNGFAIYESSKKFTSDDVNNFLNKVGVADRYTSEQFIYVE